MHTRTPTPARWQPLLLGATLALGLAGPAAARSLSFHFDYLAQANAATNQGLPLGASFSSLSPQAQSAGSITFTDLADLNLGDGKTGVRITLALTNLDQFSSGSGTRWSNSVEFSFPGTGSGGGGVEYIGSANSLRNVSGVQFTTGGDGGIEWDEHGSVGNGTANTATSSRWAFFQQQVNFVVGTVPQGSTLVFDFLNGDTLNANSPTPGAVFNGFSVDSLIPVANQNTAAGLPDAWAWLRVRSTDGGIAASGQWFNPYLQSATNANTGVTTQTLQILAVQAVPEPQTYALLLGGLALVGWAVRRR